MNKNALSFKSEDDLLEIALLQNCARFRYKAFNSYLVLKARMARKQF